MHLNLRIRVEATRSRSRAAAQERRRAALGRADAAYFAAGHLAGSLNIGLGGQYATWSGTLLDRERPIVVIAELGREYEAEIRLGRIGFDQVAGYLEGGMQALAARPELVARTERVSPEQLAEELAEASPPSEPPFLLDVRLPREWSQTRIEGSVNIPLNHLQERISDVPRGRHIVVHCASGYRSSIAASLLKRHGFLDVADLAGGINAWPAVHPTPQAGPVGGR